MTPKEKAKELVDKFYKYVAEKDFFGDNVENKFSKQCALIAVHEIIDHCSQVEPFLGTDYWLDVKKEIEQL